LTASGGVSGIVGQLDDGQNRVGGSHPTGSYCNDNGQIADAHGRGCILTPPSSQFQCDVGATPTGGFSLGNNGAVTSNGSPTFYACPATDTEYNIYTTPVPGQDKCVEIQLIASGCYTQQCSPKTVTEIQTVVKTQTLAVTKTEQPQTVTVTSVETSPTSTNKSCPTNLSGPYQFPHLIIPVSQSSPTKAYGTSYNGEINSDMSSIFNFDIPTSYTGTCSLVFLFPEQSQLTTSSYTFSGSGEIDFKQLSTVAAQATTYANQGGVEADFGVKTVTPGTSIVVETFSCPAGETVSFELIAKSGTSLTYFQDYNPSPIGLYITTC